MKICLHTILAALALCFSFSQNASAQVVPYAEINAAEYLTYFCAWNPEQCSKEWNQIHPLDANKNSGYNHDNVKNLQ